MPDQATHDNIYQALAAVNRQVDAIGKTSRNDQQGFMFRGIDDAYNTLHDILSENGVFTIPKVIDAVYSERTSRQGSALFVTKLKVEYQFWHESGTYLVVGPVIGEAMDSGDKGANKALAVAHKYALFQTFTIPTLFTDPDSESHEVAAGPQMADDETMDDIASLEHFMTDGQKKWWETAQKKGLTTAQAQKVLTGLRNAYEQDARDTAASDEEQQEVSDE